MFRHGIILQKIKPYPLLFTIPANTSTVITYTDGKFSKVRIKYRGIIYTPTIPNEYIALDTMGMLDTVSLLNK
jgi:hypothetical protein